MPETAPQTTDNRPNPLAGFSGGIPASEAEVEQIARKAGELAAAFEASVANLSAAVDAAREKFRQRHEALIPRDQPRSQVAGIVGYVRDAVDREVREYRDSLVRETEAARLDQLRQLDAARAKLASLLAVHPTPVAMLSAQGLGSEERSRYHQQIGHAGTAELANLARLAVATGNKVLGAAVLARLDTLPKEQRPFSAHHLADALVGQQHAAIDAAHKAVDAAFQRAINRNRELATGRMTPTGKIAAGLSALSAEKAAARATPAPGPKFKGV
ncbi:MAG: hypothetical protein DYG93_13140 [Leptolyngbya sp. PLA2]|nr:hypothetical protein [Leptolyngbya sp.]MCE7972592.1 hypothetical protein [Leptolyngbya sp. PL-A2]MCQ3939573.1 hypothetical protein [cyanobacterium CYA1]MDL1903829.1 hypothetical protein [Synechococcales cyanobacterium CNB]